MDAECDVSFECLFVDGDCSSKMEVVEDGG